MSRVKHLQQRLDDLRERERLAKLHNRELLQQFDEAQSTLREVLDHSAAMRMLRKNFLKVNGQVLQSHAHEKTLRKTGAYQDLSVPPEQHAQTQTSVPDELSQDPQSSFPHDLLKLHFLLCGLLQECAFTNYPGLSDCHLLHTSALNEQTETLKRSSSCQSETSPSEDLDVKPVRLPCAQGRSRTSSHASSQVSIRKRRSSSGEDLFDAQKFAPLQEVTSGSKGSALLSESEDCETSGNQKTKHELCFKDRKNKDDNTVSHSQGDVDECSDQLSQDEPQSSRLKKIPTPEDKEQRISHQSSLEDDKDDSEKGQTDENRNKPEGEMSRQDIPRCSSESDQQTSSSNSAALSESNNDTAPEDSDSEDCIVSPHTRSKIIHVIPEDEIKHQEESNSKKSSSENENCSSDEDIEKVLAP